VLGPSVVLGPMSAARCKRATDFGLGTDHVRSTKYQERALDTVEKRARSCLRGERDPEYALDMVTVSVEGERVAFNVEGMDKLWSLRSRLEIPIAHITGAEVNHEQVGRWWHGLKLLGTDLPGLFAAGMFRYHGETVFWDVRDPAQAVIVSLEHETYKKLIVEVADPAATVATLQSVIGRRG